MRFDKAASILVTLVAVAGVVACRPAEVQRPNVVLIVADTLRADRLGCYGYTEGTSPNVDRFAEDALLFENCQSHAADTRFSLASILTGFLPHETGILEREGLPSEIVTLAEMLAARGYETGAVISNYVLRDGRGFEQGFGVYDDTMNELESVRGFPERIARHTTDRAVELLREMQPGPLFLWVLYQDTHGPYTPPADFVRPLSESRRTSRSLELSGSLSGRGGIPAYQNLGGRRELDFYLSRYDGEIRYLDHHFERLIRSMKDLGIYEDSVIIFTSDHGEGLGEHDYFFAHGEYLYQDQTRVPLIMRWGKRLRGRRPDFVQHVDLVPTILDMLGIEAGAPFRGTHLFTTETRGRPIFAEMRSPFVADGRKMSIVHDGLKLVFTPGERAYELYDLARDPGEEEDLVRDPEYRVRAGALAESLTRIRGEDRLRIGPRPAPAGPDREEERRLRSLGYVERD